MILKGRAHKFGDNVNTDEIIPARYLNTIDPDILGAHCMEDADNNFIKRARKGDVIIGGKNFGCGSSREHAPLSIKAAGVSAVIAENFARIFFRNAINIGLPILESRQAAKGIRPGDEVEIDLNRGMIKNITTGKEYRVEAYPEFMQKLIKAGGLMNYVRRKV